MQITKENKDSLNAVVKLNIAKEDYSEKVDKILKDYRKTATIPGFRKGHVPLGMIKRQYGKAVLADEVNKLIQESLSKYLTEEKLDILGQPIPREQSDFSWDKEDYTFEFELGLAPEINIDFNNKKAITHYKITADNQMIEDQIKMIQRQFGKMVSQNEVKDAYTIVAKISSEDASIENETSFKLEDLKGKKNKALFEGAKVNDVIEVNSKKLFADADQLHTHLNLEKEKAKDLDVDLKVEIQEINEHIPHELNQELFDKYTQEEGKITSVDELKDFIKEQLSSQFVQHSEQQLFNDMITYLLENTKFDLPTEFLQKHIQISAENEISEEEAKAEFEKSEESFRFHLIESKLIEEHGIKVAPEEIKDLMRERLKMQMAQYGALSFPDEKIEEFTNQMLKNEDEVRRISEEVKNKKVLDLLKSKLKLKEKEVSFKKFTEEVY